MPIVAVLHLHFSHRGLFMTARRTMARAGGRIYYGSAATAWGALPTTCCMHAPASPCLLDAGLRLTPVPAMESALPVLACRRPQLPSPCKEHCCRRGGTVQYYSVYGQCHWMLSGWSEVASRQGMAWRDGAGAPTWHRSALVRPRRRGQSASPSAHVPRAPCPPAQYLNPQAC